MTPFLLSFLVRSTLLGVLGLAVIALVRRRPAAFQHAIAVGIIAAMVALPFLASVIPTHVVQVDSSPDSLVYLTATTTPSFAPPAAPTAQSIDWTPLVGYIWLAVSAILLLRVAAGLAGLARRVRRSQAVPIPARMRVAEDPSGTVPLMVWLGRPTVLLPPTWSEWPVERLERVLAHEEAHVDRGDWFTQLLLLIATAMLWPNPFAHFFAKRARVFAEHAADDRVLAAGAEPSRYASDLLEIAREAHATPPVFAIQMASKADVARRIEMILSNRPRRKKAGFLAVAFLALLAGLCVPLSSWAIGSTPRKNQAQKAASPRTYEIHARIYSLTSLDDYTSPHHFVVQKGIKCTDCHRASVTNASPWSFVFATAVDPAYAEKVVQSVTKNGGVLLSSPTVVAASSQIAEITIGPTDENRRTITMGLAPEPSPKGATRLVIRIMESVDGRTVESLNGLIDFALGKTVILTTKSKRRMAVLEIKG
ncbi:MAG TPA: M56 family metallopeptidase [Fimbriimonadaceae bacterium]|nr:M56 family metallopeptidase [Fimbriimonadaceae bacterium]